MDSGDIGFHMGYLFTLLVLRQLYQIKYEILKIVEPDRSFEYNMRIHSDMRVWELFVAKYFLDLVRDDEEYRNRAQDIIKGLIYCFENAEFDPITSLIPIDFLANPPK